MTEFNRQPVETKVDTALDFLREQYSETTIFLGEVTALQPVVLGELITYSFMYKFPDMAPTSEQATEIILADLDENGTAMGYGEISYVVGGINSALKNKPYVAYTETLSIGEHKGLNVRRLKVMNELAKRYFNFSLHSDPSGDTEPKARLSWEKLIDEGLAELYEDNGHPRYRFKS